MGHHLEQNTLTNHVFVSFYDCVIVFGNLYQKKSLWCTLLIETSVNFPPENSLPPRK